MAATGGEITLLTTQANGNGASITVNRWGNVDESHLRTLFIWGTFDSATAKLQISPDAGVTWFDVSNTDVTVATAINVEFRAPLVRGSVSGGLGSESINMMLL